jgi:hypothetical protein
MEKLQGMPSVRTFKSVYGYGKVGTEDSPKPLPKQHLIAANSAQASPPQCHGRELRRQYITKAVNRERILGQRRKLHHQEFNTFYIWA